MDQRDLSRRDFLRTTAVAATGGMAAGTQAEGGGQPSEEGPGLKSERSPTQDGDHLNTKPNIVFIFMDYLAYGELGVYGGGVLRGAATPRIDGLASEGLRLQNFNVEPSCTPTRSAIMTGRFPIRSGTYYVIEIGHKDLDMRSMGLVQWEITIADLLSQQGYATGAFGKWHLGLSEGRYPTNQGFDEWYGIPDSDNMSFWPQEPYFDKSIADFEYVMEARKGEKARSVKVFAEEARRSIDLELTQKTIEFMDRSVRKSKPFYAYVPLTQVHLPTLPSRRFEGKTGNGDWADVLAQTDWIVGQILDAVDRLGVRDTTVFIFTSDNGAEDTYPWRGWSGPWTGSYYYCVTKMACRSRDNP